MTPGRLWWYLRRDFQRGPAACWGDYILGPRVWSWRNPYATTAVEPVPVAVVLGREHVRMAAWMLASWTSATGRNWRIRLHDDGTLARDVPDRLRDLGLDVTVVSRAEADAALSSGFAARPLCRDYRNRFPLGLKIFDVAALETANRFLLLDPDVVFFGRPTHILRWVDDGADDSCWFNEDAAEASNVSSDEARERLGIALWPRVNSGLCLLARDAIDLDLCERALAETAILKGHFWRVEQTLFAVCASAWGTGGLLPSKYEVSLGRRAAPDCVARHYVGAVRQQFYREGVVRARRLLAR